MFIDKFRQNNINMTSQQEHMSERMLMKRQGTVNYDYELYLLNVFSMIPLLFKKYEAVVLILIIIDVRPGIITHQKRT